MAAWDRNTLINAAYLCTCSVTGTLNAGAAPTKQIAIPEKIKSNEFNSDPITIAGNANPQQNKVNRTFHLPGRA